MTEESAVVSKLPASCKALAKRLLKAGDFDLAVALFKKSLELDAVPAADASRKLCTWLLQAKVPEDKAWKAAGLAGG